MSIVIKGGRPFYGKALGILMLDRQSPLIPGNVGNANSYNFPVRFKVLNMSTIPRGGCSDQSGSDEEKFEMFLKKAKELEDEGVRAITTGCGFFAIYQEKAAERLRVPLFASPLLLVPMVSRMIGKNKKVGIITAKGRLLIEGDYLKNAGIDSSIPIAIGGLEDTEEFLHVICTQNKKDINPEKMEQEVVGVAKELLKKNPDIGAFVFECSDIPPYARATAEATGLPVFDFISFAHLVYWALLPCSYSGFM